MTFRSVYLKTMQYITALLLKVALKTIPLTPAQIRKTQIYPIIPIIDRGHI
jgi:hypothetical protein